MKARLRRGVRRRRDEFGGLCYVPQRDDFFALSREVYAAVASLGEAFSPVTLGNEDAFRRLAELGIAETTEPATIERAHSGVSLIGHFPELPAVTQPLVVNCFATAHCPLKCIYCHADDLMKPEQRLREHAEQLPNVIATANLIPAMVAVVTGGDPLTRPDRAAALIRGIAEDKALVLDTSGVGDIRTLVPLLKERHVHVRVSLDSVHADLNGRLRPVNPVYVRKGESSQRGAVATMVDCLAAGIPVSVQTVVTSRNDQEKEWRDLRDWLLGQGIRNWVIHIAVRGGKAREYEARQARLKRPRSLLPDEAVYSRLWALIKDTIDQDLGIDIRCTDTDNTPNSVLLVASNGDLYTEGYARKGKVLLYEAELGRPDRVQSLMIHVDRFGHARRYLNWNPWFHDRRSIEDICVPVTLSGAESEQNALVETEVKMVVQERSELSARLSAEGYSLKRAWKQRDEYYDTAEGVMRQLDNAIRLRIENGTVLFAYKGPRFFSAEGASSRLEVEVPGKSAESIRESFRHRGLRQTWFFEKRRMEYRKMGSSIVVALDEVPELGWFVELEGPLDEVRTLRERLRDCLGAIERRNYRELFVENRVREGACAEDVAGAAFAD